MPSGVARLGGGKAASSAARSSLSSVMSSAVTLARTCSGSHRLRDRDHAGLTQHPRQRHRGRIAPVLVGDLLERRLPQQRPLAQRRIGHHHDAAPAALLEQLPFDAAAAEVIEHLVGRAVLALRHARQLVHVVDVEVAHAPGVDLAVLLQGLEGLHRLGQRIGAAPMQEIEIEPIRLEPLQAALAGGNRPLARGVVRIDLADEEEIVAPPGDGLADDGLRHAFAVHLGRIDQPHAELDPQLHRRQLGRPLGRALAHAPGAEPQHRHLLSVLELHGSHLPLLALSLHMKFVLLRSCRDRELCSPSDGDPAWIRGRAHRATRADRIPLPLNGEGLGVG